MFQRRHWIPPGTLLFAQLAHVASWVLLALAALSNAVSGPSGLGLAWIHTVALGWVSMAALGILLHVIPGFTDVEWRGANVARYALVPFAIGVLLFVMGWLLQPQLMAIGAFTITLSFLCYFVVTLWTLSQARKVGRREASVASALMINLSFFFVVCLAGATMAAAIAYGWLATVLSYLPAIHANFALYGWLTMLVYGVSVRTVRPICGAESRIWWNHIIVGSSVLLGPLLFAAGIVAWPPLSWAGGILLGVGALFYAADTLDVVRRAQNRHRPPQAFIVASVLWLLVSMLLGLGVMLGKPWAPAYVFVLLVGWIGQMVNAHFLHIGVRLLVTVIRGDEDETPPIKLLDVRLSWIAFAGMQLAVLVGCAGLMGNRAPVVLVGAAAGLVAWLALLANAGVAASRARAQAISLLSMRA